METNLSTNFIEIVSGNSNHFSSKYLEAVKQLEKDDKKSAAYIKKFMGSIENIAAKNNVKDPRISESKGNIENFKGDSSIKRVMDFLKTYSSGNEEVVINLSSIYKYLKDNKNIYQEGYSKNIRLIVLEYECAVYLLTTGYATVMACIDINENNGKITVSKSKNSFSSIIAKTIADFKQQLSNKDHKKYLEALIDAKKNSKIDTDINESVTFMEGAISDSFELIDGIFSTVGHLAGTGKRVFIAIKNSLFGIVPLIRTVLYIRYKKKADTVLALEQQAQFIELNIDQLSKNQTVDPKKKEAIIKRQQAVVEGYKKKAAKLRAQLSDGEKEAVNSIKAEDPAMSKPVENEDFVLESGQTVISVFAESVKSFTRRPKGGSINAGKIKTNHANVDKVRMEVRKNSFNFNWKSKLENTDTNSINQDKWNIIFDEFCKLTCKDSIRLIPGIRHEKDDDMSKRTATKIGGNPYWPKNKPWPDSDGKLICYCQLNLDELPKLQGFPSKGIMQFFVSGPEWEDTGVGKSVQVIIHEDIVDEKDMLVEVPRSTTNAARYEHPIEGVYFPTAKLEKCPMTMADHNFYSTLIPIMNKVLGITLDPNRDSAWDYIKNDKIFWKTFSYGGGCRFGGNPYFTQSDIRDKNSSYSELLLQLDTEAGMSWGDAGIANFFISESNLKKQKFDGTVFYTWDCC